MFLGGLQQCLAAADGARLAGSGELHRAARFTPCRFRVSALRKRAPETLLSNSLRLHAQTGQNGAARFHERWWATEKEIRCDKVLDRVADEFTADMPSRAGPLRVRLRQQQVILKVLQAPSQRVQLALKDDVVAGAHAIQQ